MIRDFLAVCMVVVVISLGLDKVAGIAPSEQLHLAATALEALGASAR